MRTPAGQEPVGAGFLVGTGRFELPTCRLGGDRSIHLSYVPAHFAAALRRDTYIVASQPFAANVGAVVHAFELNVTRGLIYVLDC